MFRKTVSSLILVLLVVSVLEVAVKTQPVSVDSVDWWPMFHHDPGHTGTSTSTAPTTNNLLWNYTTGNAVFSSPAVADGLVYVGSEDDYVYCLNATTGSQVWNYTTGDGVDSSAAVVGGLVYIGSADDYVYCLNATTGAFVWSYRTGNDVQSAPAVVGGFLYVGSMDGNVYCLNAANGAFVWNYRTDNWVLSSPTVVGSLVYVGSMDGNVYCLNAGDGSLVWNYATGNSVLSSPAVARGFVYVGSFDDYVYCLNATTGAFVWSCRTGNYAKSSPAVVNGYVYTGSADGNIYCLNSTKGTLVWSYATLSSVFSSPAVVGGSVYVGCDNTKVYCLNAGNGSLVWSYATGDVVYSSPAVVNGVAYVGSDDGKIYAFGSSSNSTSTILNCSPNPVSAGESVTCTVTVYGSDPTGTVSLSTNSSTGFFTTSQCTLSSGTCSTIYSDTGSGIVAITAIYSGDSGNLPSDDTVVLRITSPATDTWPMFHHDLSHSGTSTSTAPKTNQTLWIYNADSAVRSSPIVTNGMVYVGSDSGRVYALNATTGNSVWNYTTGMCVFCSPAFEDGIVYVGSYDGRVYALNADTGKYVWSTFVGPNVASSPAVIGGLVYVGSTGGRVYALNASNGASVWSYATGGPLFSTSPAVVDGVVYTGSYDNKTYALNATTGSLIWNYTTGAYLSGSAPTVVNGIFYMGSCDSRVYALNATTGGLLWSYATGSWVESCPAIANGILYIGSCDSKVYALNATNGKYVWSFTTAGLEYSSPAVVNGVVFIGSCDNKTYALNATTGSIIWSYDANSSAVANGIVDMTSSPAVANGIVYIGLGNELCAFGNPSNTTAHLIVNVVNSCGQNLSSASVSASNLVRFTDISGDAYFDLPFGVYNVTAELGGYVPANWTVDLAADTNITLTLGYNFTFEGEIPDSNIILTPIPSGYNMTLLNPLTSSPMDVFFDWQYMGNISAGTWQSFSFNHLPSLIVVAASNGSSDYPKAWYSEPVPMPLTPTTRQTSAFLPEPVPYAAGSIFVNPYPPSFGQNTTIGVTLHNPYNYTLNITRLDFQVSGLTVGGTGWTSVGFQSNITLGANETNVFTTTWIPNVNGHHCVRVVQTNANGSLTLQRNLDVENGILQGQTGQVSFSIENPYQTSKNVTLNLVQQLPHGWDTRIEINGQEYNTSSAITINLSAGGQVDAVLSVDSSQGQLGQAVVNVEAYIDGQLIGGLQKTMQTSANPTSVSITFSSNPAPVNSGVTCIATVSGSDPTGTITWNSSSRTGAFTQSVCTLSSGSCSTTYTDTSPGTATIITSYGGDSDNLPSNGNNTLTIANTANIKKYLVMLVRDTNGRVLMNPSEIQKGATVYFYFQVKAWDGGSTYTPVNGIQVTVNSIYDQTFTSKEFGGLDGIIQAGSYNTTSFSGTEIPIQIPDTTFNGIPVTYYDAYPYSTITPRTSTAGVGFNLDESASLGANVEGSLQNQFLIENDGVNPLGVTISESSKIGAGYTQPIGPGFAIVVGSLRAKVGAGVGVDAGTVEGADYYCTDPTGSTQSSLIRDLVTLLVLNDAEVQNPDLGFILDAIKSSIQDDISNLGSKSYYSPIHAGGWFQLTADVAAQLQIESSLIDIASNAINTLSYGFDANKLTAHLISAGGTTGGSVEISAELEIYPDTIGIRLDVHVEGYLGYDLGCASFTGTNKSFDLIDEFMFDRATLNLVSIVCSFEQEVTTEMFASSQFGGLLKTVNLAGLLLQPSETYRITETVEIPATNAGKLYDLLTASNLLKLSASPSIIDCYDLLQDVGETVMNGVVANYTITLEPENAESFSFELSGLPGMGKLGISVDFNYVQSQSFLKEYGHFTYANGEFVAWPAVNYTETPPQSIDVKQFILNNLIDWSSFAKSLATVVQMQESQSKLYLSVYDSNGNHVGFNFAQNTTDLNIPGSYYFDNLNGTIDIVLPDNLTSFRVAVDGSQAQQELENFTLGIFAFGPSGPTSRILRDQLIERGTIWKNFVSILANGSIEVGALITFDQLGIGSDFRGTVVTIDGTNYTTSHLPVSLVWDEDSNHNFSFASSMNVNARRGYCWWYTSGLSSVINGTLTVTASGNITATFGLIGDLNHDGKVSLTDLVMFAAAWHSSPGDANWNPECDVAAQGRINLVDLLTLAMHYGQHYP